MAHPDRLQREIDSLMRDYEMQRDDWLRHLDAQIRAMGVDPAKLPPPGPDSLSRLRQHAERALAACLPPRTVRELISPNGLLQVEDETVAAGIRRVEAVHASLPLPSREVRRRLAVSGV